MAMLSKIDDIQKFADVLDVMVIDSDGSFQFAGKRYLQAISCSIDRIDVDFQDLQREAMNRKDFRVNSFQITVSENNVKCVYIFTRDILKANGLPRMVRPRDIEYHDGKPFLSVKVINAIVSRDIIQCNPLDMSVNSPVGTFGIRDPHDFLIEANIDQFYCVGESTHSITKEMILSSVEVLNRAKYGNEYRWFYDEPVNYVRVIQVAKYMLRPSEAIQIAHQLGKGGWASMDRRFFEVEKPKELEHHDIQT